MDLFDSHRQRLERTDAPLAARLRPRTLDEFVGQQHIIGPGRLLRRAIQADQLSSLLFYGPPGTGKTTLARIIANTTRSHFISVNAVLAGVKEIRAAIATAQEQRGQQGQRTILFVDEVHRFNKAQQDALLPWVENGTIVLIGATTENPYFEVNKALVSRSRLFRLLPLEEEDLRQVVHQALKDTERGYGDRSIHIDPEALEHLVSVASGDARTLLNALELAIETTPPIEGTIHITLAVAEDSIQQRAVLYDKEGDAHFDTISAFIKSVRGSDPDAALYWLARMVYAGEDPRFLFRRLVILASEDVGLADPNAVGVVTACAQAFDRVGMPEGRYPLAQATLYLATAPKSNSAMGFFDALAAVERERAEVPPHLQDPNRDADLGHGQQYRYPHAYQDHWVAQQYLPDGLQGQVFYQPSAQGYEGEIAQQVQRRREAQISAIASESLPEIFTLSPEDTAADRWLQRSLSQTSQHLAHVRDRLFDILQPQRHQVLLVANAHDLLLWEAVRRVPEGGVYAAATPAEQAAIAARVQWAGTGLDKAALPALRHPLVLPALEQLGASSADVEFDGIVARNLLLNAVDRTATLEALAAVAAPKTAIALAESLPQDAQRISTLLTLSPELHQALTVAEDTAYQADPKTWGLHQLTYLLQASPLTAQIDTEALSLTLYLSPDLIHRWTGEGAGSYRDRLQPHLSPEAVAEVCRALQGLTHQTVSWQIRVAFVQLRQLP
ncbi:MAG: AAA family ATPase [Cyanobacteria bacterium P01_A01_bin.135]